MILGAYSDAGSVKPVNQDAYCFKEATTSHGAVCMAVVCDGVGGLAKGELASTTVALRFADWFDGQLPKFLSYNVKDGGLDFDALKNVWGSLLQSANDDIYRYGKGAETVLGTTCTGMLVHGGSYLVAHVGDCRLYEVTNEACVQVTRDQTLVAQQVAQGILTPEEARCHPKRNVIMQSVGTQEDVVPEFVAGSCDRAAVYVMCCDGFYGKISTEELHERFRPASIGSEQQLQRRCEDLARIGMDRGERDNITVLAFSLGGFQQGDIDEDIVPTTVVEGGAL